MKNISKYFDLKGNEEGEGSMFGDSPRKTIKQTHIFLELSFKIKHN